MLVVISPAKRLDWSPVPDIDPTEPVFVKEANRLAGHARQLSVADLKRLMGISENLARLNAARFQDIRAGVAEDDLRPAAFAFAGDTYQGLEARSLDADTLTYAQRHLRILSGLYGLLRPLDGIKPYRLEMGSGLKSRRGDTLYDFWHKDIAAALNAQAEETGADLLVNCASNEYFGAVDRKALRPRIITPVFLEERDGEAKTISFFAKRARGAMARFVMERRIDRAEGLEEFDTGGYRLDPARSSAEQPVFTRPHAVAQQTRGAA